MIIRVGSGLGVGMRIVGCTTLLVSLTPFFIGGPNSDVPRVLGGSGEDSDPFVQVFVIVFPAFAGMTAGVGLSADLQNRLCAAGVDPARQAALTPTSVSVCCAELVQFATNCRGRVVIPLRN